MRVISCNTIQPLACVAVVCEELLSSSSYEINSDALILYCLFDIVGGVPSRVFLGSF